MPKFDRQAQDILNRAFQSSTNKLAIGTTTAAGDNDGTFQRSAQEIFNLAYDADKKVLRMAGS
ncbi:MAG: hypothetical protein V3W51_04780 [Candidatus Brocadiales bacterium]